MNLILEIINTPKNTILQKSINFDENGGTIGRNQKATWVLHDPTRFISNFHAKIDFKNGKYYITDTSTNGMYLKNPDKKLLNNTPEPLDEKQTIQIGDLHISVKILEGEFIDTNPISHISAPPSMGIPDSFFTGDSEKDAFSVIAQDSVQEADIMSLVGEDEAILAPKESVLLPELDQIFDSTHTSNNSTLHDTLTTHIEAPTLEPIQFSSVQKSHTNVEASTLKILSLKLGIDIEEMPKKEREDFISQLADLALTSLEQVRSSYQALVKIQQDLDFHSVETASQENPFKKQQHHRDILSNMPQYSTSLSEYMTELFHEINTHNVAFFTAFKHTQSEENFTKFKKEYDAVNETLNIGYIKP